MGATIEPREPTVESTVHDAEVSTMSLAPTTAPTGARAGRLPRDLTAIGYGLFALQQPGSLNDLAEVAGTVHATGRVSAARSSGQTAPDDPQVRPRRAATPDPVATAPQHGTTNPPSAGTGKDQPSPRRAAPASPGNG